MLRTGGRRAVASWALWDWGSASFNAVIVTFVFAPYLTTGVAGSEEAGSQALGWATAAAGLVIALVAPAAGTRADAGGRHRFWLGFHTFVVVACMAAMFFVKDTPGHLWLGLVLLALGNVFFEFAEVSYNSILLSVSTPGNVGRISGIGWGMGYLGGLALLVILLATVISTGGSGCSAQWTKEDCATASWLCSPLPGSRSSRCLCSSSLPDRPFRPAIRGTLRRLRRADSRGSSAASDYFLADYRRLIRRIVRMWREDRLTLRFLIASAVFRDGLAAIFAFAGVLAAGLLRPLRVRGDHAGRRGERLRRYRSDRRRLDRRQSRFLRGHHHRTHLPHRWDRFPSRSPTPPPSSGRPQCSCACSSAPSSPRHARTSHGSRLPRRRVRTSVSTPRRGGRSASWGPVMFASAIALLGYQRAGALGIALVLVVGLFLFWSLRRSHSKSLSAERSSS